MKKFQQIKTNKTIPDYEDYMSAAQALLRLQAIYYLNINDIIKGVLPGKKTTASNIYI